MKHRIETGNTVPIRQRPRRLPLHQRGVAEAEIDSMLKRDIIKPATGPWALPIVLVRKKDGKVRFCVGLPLNSVTRKDAYPIPRIDDTIDTLSGSKFFTTLDLASGVLAGYRWTTMIRRKQLLLHPAVSISLRLCLLASVMRHRHLSVLWIAYCEFYSGTFAWCIWMTLLCTVTLLMNI